MSNHENNLKMMREHGEHIAPSGQGGQGIISTKRITLKAIEGDVKIIFRRVGL
ncbi:hypothetical protein J4207_03480 [Candidatus Woesearchaeota archaeon]|nr:hypothetical protein [Candidatus Woesearchaeota archaeon]